MAVSPSQGPSAASMASAASGPRAYSDPCIFRSERVLRTLLRRELRLNITTSKNYYGAVQTEVKPAMRQEVAGWMLGLCEEEAVQPQVFCLAINYLDRFLAVCNIRRSQLQLLAAVCLLVSWKVRAHSSITAQKLVEFSDYNVSLEDLLEWEFLLLSKLDWDLSAVIAPDFVEHILQRLLKLDLAWDIERTRARVSTLVCLSYSQPGLATLSPSLLATSAVLTSLRPGLEAGGALLAAPRDTPSPSSSSSSPAACSASPGSPLLPLLRALERLLPAQDRREVLGTMGRLEAAMAASLPPSPEGSEDEAPPCSSPLPASRRLFPASPGSPPGLATGLDSGLDLSQP